jgi:hypothetical protein
MNKSIQDRIIEDNVANLSFVDIGGIWGTINEKVTVAAKAGAISTAMADIQPEGSEGWQMFRDRALSLGVEDYSSFPQVNLDSTRIVEEIGVYDFVHCAGILYHVPSPLFTLERLHSVTKKYLLLGSMVVPEKVSNRHGDIDFGGGRAIFIPSLDQRSKAIMAEHFDRLGLKIMHINADVSEDFRVAGRPNYGPWWWLYSSSTLADFLTLSGFRIIQSEAIWGGRSCYIFCERVS